ncbi:hypothetical protein [Mesobacillus foraminis]|uniref:Uncharacterized protein n=1 Tax=Mesobacillus foraminis TaxID=279826 RepID=A0A4R2BM30_9BACI|nr:hypothetical protein [Mesobacillus foraminis]TCN27279.1 hypothetical protein EV146_102226 [Mesobacillus foraminis]
MLKVFSTSVLSLALAGALVIPGLQAEEENAQEKSTYNLHLAEYVGAAPELAEKTKKLGVDLSKSDPAEKAAEKLGTKFQRPGDHQVSYQEATGDIPVLVILAK